MDSREQVELGPANRGERPRKKEAAKRVGGQDSRGRATYEVGKDF